MISQSSHSPIPLIAAVSSACVLPVSRTEAPRGREGPSPQHGLGCLSVIMLQSNSTKYTLIKLIPVTDTSKKFPSRGTSLGSVSDSNSR